MWPSSTVESRDLARFRRRLSRGAWLFPKRCRRFSRLGCRFKRRRRVQLGLFRSAMVAMAQRLDARSLIFRPLLCVSTFLALVREICRNRFSCHSQSVAELAPSKLSNFGHSGTIHGTQRRGGWRGRFVSLYGARGRSGGTRRPTAGPPGLGTPTAFLLNCTASSAQ